MAGVLGGGCRGAGVRQGNRHADSAGVVAAPGKEMGMGSQGSGNGGKSWRNDSACTEGVAVFEGWAQDVRYMQSLSLQAHLMQVSTDQQRLTLVSC